MRPITLAYQILRHLGPRFALSRSLLQLKRISGKQARQFKNRSWQSVSLKEISKKGTPTSEGEYSAFKTQNPPPFFFPLGAPPAIDEMLFPAEGKRTPTLEDRVALLAEGRATYFFHQPSPTPIDWYENGFDQQRADHAKPWYLSSDYQADQGDPRFLWEPSRAAWAFDLARISSRSPHLQEAAELYQSWLKSWLAACPPFLGFQWYCGQETAIRLSAIIFGFWALSGRNSHRDNAWNHIAKFAWASAYRIDCQIDYAISQKNNHALNEALGLLLVAHLFPEFKESKRWLKKGATVFEKELKRQVYRDGSYVQHSFNYQRLALDASMLALRLGELAERPFSTELYGCIDRMVCFLYQMVEPTTGQLPLYGHNDGACLLPLSECDFGDFRPSLQCAYYLVHQKRLFEPGPWDEPLLWLFSSDPSLKTKECEEPGQTSRDRNQRSIAFETGGYYTIRKSKSWAMLRCHRFRDRPGQADQLHLDLFWHGTNVLRDCGTYRYFTPGREHVADYFKSVAAHNRVEIDGQDPFQRPSRFLSFPWPKGIAKQSTSDQTEIIIAETNDYQRSPWNVRHRRIVLALSDDLWLVVDDLMGRGKHLATLRYHLANHRYENTDNGVILHTPRGEFCVTVASDQGEPRTLAVLKGIDTPDSFEGFASPHYGELQAIPLLKASWEVELPLRIFTVAGGLGARIQSHTKERCDILDGTHRFGVKLPAIGIGIEAYGKNIHVLSD